MTLLAIVIGAAFGAPLRFIVDRGVTQRSAGRHFAWGLLTVNVLGSAFAGIILATTEGFWRMLLLIGFCGAFTTFSGFGWEANRLWSVARPQFWSTVVVMPLACTAAFLITWTLAGR